MPGMMRSRKGGWECPCCSVWTASRAAEKRAWAHWRDEYDTAAVNECDDECPRDHRPCPFDADLCCTATALTAN